jgi:anaerobic dimethyl sulfoxide reductase subunit A
MYVSDGVVLRQKTDDTGTDGHAIPQQRSCARGRSLRRWVYGEDRLKYPLKRKSWQPGGETINGNLRGIDEWERITWDEALDIIASEFKRITAKYGNTAVLSAYGGDIPVFQANGGYTGSWGPISSGGLMAATTNMVGGGWTWHPITESDRFEYLNTKLIVVWAQNYVPTVQFSIYNMLAAKEAGARVIVVDPVYTETARVLADQFIQVRPSTDAALLIGMAYVIITNNLQDQEFLDKYTVGFDADHLPEGADPKDNFKDYVLGTYDGIPKTPEWASEICGTPVDVIESFAKEIATTKPMMMSTARGAARITYGEQFCQTFLTVGWMTGNVGKPGAFVGHCTASNKGSGGGGPQLIKTGSLANETKFTNPIYPGFHQMTDGTAMKGVYSICVSEMWNTILNGHFVAGLEGDVPVDIKMAFFWFSGNSINMQPGTATAIEACRSLEFVLATGMNMKATCLYADIVLPEALPLEKAGEWVYVKNNREVAIAAQQISPPPFEAKSQLWINEQLGLRFDLTKEQLNPFSEEQQSFEALRSATVVGADGKTPEPLFTITANDIPEGIEAEPQEGRITLQQFFEDKIYKLDVKPDDNYQYRALKAFIDDPDANPRETPSGKLEIHCQSLATMINNANYNSFEWSPIPKYYPPIEGYEDTFSDWENKVKGPYPLQNYSSTALRTAHSGLDNVPWLREAFPSDLMINPIDATERGIKNGDDVLITSRWGKSLRHAWVTETIMPGVTRLDAVSWVDVDPETGIDRGGCANYLNGPIATGVGIQAYNSCNVQVEKWTGEPLDADYLRPQIIVEV